MLNLNCKPKEITDNYVASSITFLQAAALIDKSFKMKRLLIIVASFIYLNSFAQTSTTDSITANAQKLSKLLDSVHLDKLWLKGYNVDWLTGISVSKGGATHCSAFAASFADKLGVYFLRPPQHSQTLLANAQCIWLASDSAKGLGWTKVATALEAQNLANKGTLVVVGYQSPSVNSSGHMAVIRPYIKTLTLMQQEGPQEAQSGDINSNSIAVKNGFSSHPLAWPNGVIYYQHPVNWDSLFADINGHVVTPIGTNIPSVRLGVTGTVITGNMLDNTFSTNTGYTLSELVGGNYTIRPTKQNELLKTNGVSVADALLIQAHILGKTILNSPYKLIAADVDGSGTITTLDILYLKRFILGLDTTFKGNRTWAFVDKNYIFPNPANPFPYKDSIRIYSLNKSVIPCNFIGVKLGDVRYDWNAALFGELSNKIKPISIYYDKAVSDGSSIIKMPVRVKDFNNIAGLQYTLEFNANKLSFVGIENNVLSVEYASNHSSEGKVPILWMNNNGTGKTIQDSTIIMELVFNTKGETNLDGVSISSSLISAEAWDANWNKIKIVKAVSTPIKNTEDFIVSPNPSNGIVQLKWLLNQSKTVTIQLFNSIGKLITQQSVTANANGVTSINLEQKAKLTAGIYYVKVLGINSDTVKKIIIQ